MLRVVARPDQHRAGWLPDSAEDVPETERHAGTSGVADAAVGGASRKTRPDTFPGQGGGKRHVVLILHSWTRQLHVGASADRHTLVGPGQQTTGSSLYEYALDARRHDPDDSKR